MGASEIAAFLTWLATERRVSPSTQNQALSALLFLYREVLHIEIGQIADVTRARMPVRVPVVVSRDEVARIMKHLDGVTWIMVALLYGAGLRLQECLELRVKDLDLERRQIVIRRGKGQKDRPTVLSAAAIEPLERHLEAVKRQHQDDLCEDSGASCCRLRSTGSTRTHRRSGPGNSSFRRLAYVGIRDGGRRRASTFTNPSCRRPSHTRRGKPVL
jgi:integrase